MLGVIKKWKNAVMCMFLASLLIIAMVAIETLCPMNNNCNNIFRVDNLLLLLKQEQRGKNGSISGCNLFSGKWVHDNVSYPLYKEGQCSLMEDKFTSCEKFGRKDFKYQNWRWQPHHCDIPRFNGTALLEKIRGKKLVYVGDSLTRNQWKSMLCLIESYLPPSPFKSRKSQVKLKGNLYTFHSIEYNATIGFYWSPLLVESNCDEPEHHSVIQTRTVKMESIEKHGRHWIDADILVFSSFTWWTPQAMTILWGSFESPDSIYTEVKNYLRLFEMVLNTWSEWLEMHMDRSRTKIFFMSHLPIHFGDRMREKFHCYNQTEPILDETYWPTSVNRPMMQIVESTVEKLEQRGLKVEYLNITQLSGYRRDAHPSIYLKNPFNKSNDAYVYSDCVHWCLPGVPDIWNQILYAYIMKY